jgi:hypothetical protein
VNLRTVALFSAIVTSARGNTSIPVEVPRHELGVLRAIHGGNLHVNGPIDDTTEVPTSAADEIARLQAKYRQPNQKDPVRLAFPSGPEDLDRFGFDVDATATQAQQSDVIRHPKAAELDSEPPAPVGLGDSASLAAFEAANARDAAQADREAELQAREAALAERERAAAEADAAAAEAAAKEAAAKAGADKVAKAK